MKYLLNKKINIFILALFISIIPNITKAAFVGASAPVTATTSCNTGLSCGLVGYWTFDGKNIVNGVVKDMSGSGNDGNTVNIASSTFYAPGKIGQAGDFDGVDDRVQTGNNIIGTNPVSVCAWIYPRGLGGSNIGRIVDNNGLVLEVFSSNRLQLSRDTNTHVVYSAVNTFSFNKWSHVCATVISNIANMYSNGVISGTPNQDLTTTVAGGSNLAIGNSPTLARAFNGIIDDVRIYNRVLSAQEIQQLYSMGASNKIGSTAVASSTNACTTGISCGLVGYWTFDGKDIVNGVILDKSGTGNNGNPSGIASSTFYAPGKIGQGGNFSGSANVVVPDHTSLKPSGAMSWGGWMYQSTDNTNQTFMSKVTIGSQGYMIYNSANSSTLCYAYGLTPSFLSDALGSIQKYKWIHYMCVYDGSTLKIYRNGSLLRSGSVTGSITHTTNQLYIGSYDGGTRFTGKVDDVRIYNRALSAQEVQQLYSMGASNKLSSSATASSTTACTVGLACGLVGYWTFDGKDISNGVLLDKSGNNNKGNFINIASTTFYTPGKLGQGGNFDGVNDKVLMGDNLDLIGSPLTISAWVNPTSYSGLSSNSPSIVDKLLVGGNYRLNLLSSGNAVFVIRDTGGSAEQVVSSNNSVPLNKWTNILVTYDNSTTGRIYINGVLNSSKTNFTLTRGDTSSQLQIGNNDNNANSIFSGKIDDVRIYNRVLSVQEVLQLYNAGK